MNKINSFIHKTLDRPLVRFLLVGGLNTGVGYGIFATLLYVNLSYPLALLLSTICGVLFNFKTIGALVFRNKDHSLIFKFVMVYGIIYLLNLSGIKMFKASGVNVYLGTAILLLPMALLAFVLNKKFVFNESKIEKNN